MKKLFSTTHTKGYIVLFSMVISAIVLSIIIGLSNIAFRQRVFTKESKEATRALSASDVALECATAYDLTSLFELDSSGSPVNPSGDVGCIPSQTRVTYNWTTNSDMSISFTTPLFATSDDATTCGMFVVTKNKAVGVDVNGAPVLGTEVISKGYNLACDVVTVEIANSTKNQTLVERSLGYTYTLGN